MADATLFKAGLPASARRTAQSPTFGAAAEVANLAISTFHSYQMDKIKYEMQQDVVAFQREGRVLDRQMQAWMLSRNKEKLQESLATERLALNIEQMRQLATVQNKAAAANISNASSVVRNVQRDHLRASLYQERSRVDQLEKLRVSTTQSMKNDSVVYDPVAPDGAGAFAEFGIQALTVGQEAFKPFVPQQEG